jgi:hypothetical protein
MSPSVAKDIPAGMRLDVAFGYRRDSAATRIQRTIERLWNQAQDQH